jgi:DNA ligase (NAD+)
MELINEIKSQVKHNKIDQNILMLLEENIDEIIENINNVKLLEMIINYAKNKYFNDEAILSDYAYDKLIYKMELLDPNNKVLTDVGYKIDIVNKVKLLYHMGSMNKTKPDTPEKLLKFKNNFKGPYILSNKLDGVSGMLIIEKNKKYLYTRGDGKIGSDISHILPYVNVTNLDNVVKYLNENNLSRMILRCEIIIPIKTFFEKYESVSANPRNFVSGQVNAKQISGNVLNDIHLVFYEIIEPWTTIDQQYSVLTTLRLRTSPFELCTYERLTNEYLQQDYKKRKETTLYEIDGIIISDIGEHERNVENNPEYSIAFKESSAVAKAIVDYVEWNLSKDKYFKPRVKIVPIKLSGVTITHATANNAKFVYDNKIGPGAELLITRSGEVIPKILKVLKPASHPQMPTIGLGNWEWNETGVDILLMSDEMVPEQLIKILSLFAKKLDIKYIDESTFKTLVDNKVIERLSDIFYLTKNDLMELEGFQEKKTNKILMELNTGFNKMHLVDLMIASNILGRGLGPKKIKKIMSEYPDITLQSYKPYDELVKMIVKIDGFDDITAKKFITNLDAFNEFLEEIPTNIRDRLMLDTIPKRKNQNNKKKQKNLNGLKIVFTGFRNKEWEKIITDNGGEISSSVSKNIGLVVCEDLDDTSNKLIKAKDLGIKILLRKDFDDYMRRTYGITLVNLTNIVEI